jgi:protein ImuA
MACRLSRSFASASSASKAGLRGGGRRFHSASGRSTVVCSGGGLALGALHEVAGGGNGVVDGAAAGLFAAGIAARTRGTVLWCVVRQDLFAPAIAQAGLGPDRVIYVEAGDEKSLLACFEEGLRHGGLGAVVAEVARLSMMARVDLGRPGHRDGASRGACCGR